jgi:pimeloyl-ACP methyl ester carboxylesterase
VKLTPRNAVKSRPTCSTAFELGGFARQVTSVQPQPYRLDVHDDVLDDLRERLTRTRWPDEIPQSGWRYGSNLAFMRLLTDRWRDVFDWRAQEAKLNAFDQFQVPLDGINLHFIHQRGVGPDPVPLLLVHGWPGSVWEFHELIPRLTDPARFGGDPADAFTVVAPSLPGFTLSFEPGQPRLGIVEMADLFARLMTEILGYSRFAAQGGDWGGYIVGRLAHAYSDKLLGVHLNFLPLPLDMPFSAVLTDADRAYQEEIRRWQTEETGYSSIQGTRPQTPAYGLTDSPTGLAAWIAEKFYMWTDHNGDIEPPVDIDWLLTNITLYWVTGAINSSFWPYYAVRHAPWPVPLTPSGTPTAYASFPREIRHPPRSFAEQAFNIQRWTEMPRGGHFAALEAPDLLAADVATFFRSLRGR